LKRQSVCCSLLLTPGLFLLKRQSVCCSLLLTPGLFLLQLTQRADLLLVDSLCQKSFIKGRR